MLLPGRAGLLTVRNTHEESMVGGKAVHGRTRKGPFMVQGRAVAEAFITAEVLTGLVLLIALVAMTTVPRQGIFHRNRVPTPIVLSTDPVLARVMIVRRSVKLLLPAIAKAATRDPSKEIKQFCKRG